MALSLTAGDRSAWCEAGRGDVLGRRYELVEPVGRGGMSVVWRARDLAAGGLVAVKVSIGRGSRDPRFRECFSNEVRFAMAVSHPSIVRVCDHRSDGAAPFLAMEFVDGVDLQNRLTAGVMSLVPSMRIGAQVAAALTVLHDVGVVHCDIKPSNVMLTGAGVKVVDFGIAAAAGSRPPGSDSVQVLGTPAYVAPERLRGGAVFPAVDVYALGVLLYRLLVGRSPWSVERTMEVLAAHISAQPAPIPAEAHLPDAVHALVMRCLDKSPAMRPTAREAALVLFGAALGKARTPDPADRSSRG